MAIDGQIMFVGSFNFDQRSLFINDEIGILFHEPAIAGDASRRFDDNVEKVALRVELARITTPWKTPGLADAFGSTSCWTPISESEAPI